MKIRIRMLPIETLDEGTLVLNMLTVGKKVGQDSREIHQGPCILEYSADESQDVWLPVEFTQ
jgi:hypothetical protein